VADVNIDVFVLCSRVLKQNAYRLADICINSATNCSISCKKWWKSVQ